MGLSYLAVLARFRFLFILALSMAGFSAHAQLIERMDVVPGNNEEVEIVIRFSQKVCYLRHTPENEGRTLRVYLQLVDGPLIEGELSRETLRSSPVERVPDVQVVYPELKNSMLLTFSHRTSYTVRPAGDGRSIVVVLPLLPVSAIVDTQVAKDEPDALLGPALTAAEVEARAATYMAEARQAMDDGDLRLAINRLNRILGLPACSQTEPAQALVGEVRELSGEPARARIEYELYLKMFPRGPNVRRVKKRLLALKKIPVIELSPVPVESPVATTAKWTLNGSLAVYKYDGKSRIETTTLPPGELVVSRETNSFTDQNSLVTSLNLNARRRMDTSDTRIVVRDVDNRNFLNSGRTYNRLYSAYVDHADRDKGYQMRVGRQSPDGMGILERFDGVRAGYNLGTHYRVNAVYANAVEFGSDFDKLSYGLSADLLPQSGRPGVSLYGVEQTLDGYVNRRAVGTEVRYFDGKASVFGLLDYDLLFDGVNTLLLQGNYLDDGRHNYYFALDHRRSPSLGLTNAMAGAPGVSLQELIANEGLDVVREQAKALTAVSNMFSAGLTRTLSDNWQLGADYRLSSISGTEGVVVTLPLDDSGICYGVIDNQNNTCVFTTSQEGSGNNHAVSFQAIGSHFLVPNSTGVANVSVVMAPTYSGQSVSLRYAVPFSSSWRVDLSLRYYAQHDDVGDNKQKRKSSGLKVAYQWQRSLYLEMEVGRDISESSRVMFDDHMVRDYLISGLRWDFH